MLNLVILVIAAFAGLAEMPWWIILLAAFALSIESLKAQWEVVARYPILPRDWNVWRLFVESVGLSIACAAGSYLFGAAVGSLI